MRRFAVLGLFAPLLVLPAASGTEAPSCRGEPATILAAGDGIVLGTDGPDVIVSVGARHVRGGAGDDLICMPARLKRNLLVYGQDGDDVIVVDGGSRNRVYPGAGDDLVIGGPGDELIRWSYPEEDGLEDDVDPGADVIRAGGGSDSVAPGGVDGIHHRIDLGAGADWLSLSFLDRLAEDGELVGGPGADVLGMGGFDPTGEASHLRVDNARRVAELDGEEAVEWTGFETFGLPGLNLDRVTFVGGKADEQVILAGGPTGYRIRLGPGDDLVSVHHPRRGGVTLTGGTGRDRLELEYDAIRVDLDVVRGTVLAPGSPIGAIAFTGLERYHVNGARKVSMSGGAGPDVLAASGNHVRLWGNGGPDRLFGGRGDDLLVGGLGRDVGRGRGGDDRCIGVERRISC